MAPGVAACHTLSTERAPGSVLRGQSGTAVPLLNTGRENRALESWICRTWKAQLVPWPSSPMFFWSVFS